jgi:hypothetical protein
MVPWRLSGPLSGGSHGIRVPLRFWWRRSRLRLVERKLRLIDWASRPTPAAGMRGGCHRRRGGRGRLRLRPRRGCHMERAWMLHWRLPRRRRPGRLGGGRLGHRLLGDRLLGANLRLGLAGSPPAPGGRSLGAWLGDRGCHLRLWKLRLRGRFERGLDQGAGCRLGWQLVVCRHLGGSPPAAPALA